MVRTRTVRAAWYAAMVISWAAPASGEIIGDIVRVGYQVTRGACVRVGSWVPVIVDLTLQGEDQFDGQLRLRQFDRDGDICVDSVPVHLSAGGGAQQRYWLYTVANPHESRAGNFEVELLRTETDDAKAGERVAVISGGVPVPALSPPQRPFVLDDNRYLVLSVGQGTMGRVASLADDELRGAWGRDVFVAHESPAMLPTQWIGLEMVDAIVWEEADATDLTEAQEQALEDWIRQGGTLVLAAARTADTLAAATYLGPLMPVQIGDVASVKFLPVTRRTLLQIPRDNSDAEHYASPVTLVQCAVVDDPAVDVVLREPAAATDLVTVRRVGRGRLLFVAASIGDLLNDRAADVDWFFERLFWLRRSGLTGDQTVSYVPVYRVLDRQVGFTGQSGAFLAIALVFASAYVLLATFGTWRLLDSRRLLRHSWTAMGLLAVGASALAIVGVQAMHGVGRSVHQLTIVDGVAGEIDATATSYFGLKTSVHREVDVWLPQDPLMADKPHATPCALKPMHLERARRDGDTTFTDPTPYDLQPSTAEVRGVPVRATLKQFEGRWFGQLKGRIQAEIGVVLRDTENQRDLQVTDTSRLTNGLDVALDDCYLILASQNPMFTMTSSSERRATSDLQARAYPLGRIEPGATVDVYEKIMIGENGRPIGNAQRTRYGLNRIPSTWGNRFWRALSREARDDLDTLQSYSLSDVQDVVMLQTVLSEIRPDSFEASTFGALPAFSRQRCRQLDLSDQLTTRSALFVGFADDAGPVRLAVGGGGDYRVAEPDKAQTVYRFVVPVEIVR